MPEIPAHNPITPSGDTTSVVDPLLEVFAYTPEELHVLPDSAQTVFGTAAQCNATLVYTPRVNPVPQKLQHNFLFCSCCLILFMLFAWITHRFRVNIPLLFKIITRKDYLEKLIQEQNILFKLFLGYCGILGILMLLIIFFRCFTELGPWIDHSISAQLTRWFYPLVGSALLGIYLYKIILYRLIQWIVGEASFLYDIRFVNRAFLALGSILLTPFALLGCFLQPPYENIALWIILIPLFVLILAYLLRTFQFFVNRKFSILEWILYLCAVEILPVSFFLILLNKSI